jgi:hypothetical protein
MASVVGVRKSYASSADGDIMRSMTKDRGEPVSIPIDEKIKDLSTLKSFLISGFPKQVNIYTGAIETSPSLRVLSMTVKLDMAGPYIDLCYSLTNMFFSQATHQAIAELRGIPVEYGTWYLNVKVFPLITDIRKGGVDEYKLNVSDAESLRICFVIPYKQTNEDLTIVDRTNPLAEKKTPVRALEGSGNVRVFPPSMTKSYEFTASTKNNRSNTRTENAMVAAFQLIYILNPASIVARSIQGADISTSNKEPIATTSLPDELGSRKKTEIRAEWNDDKTGLRKRRVGPEVHNVSGPVSDDFVADDVETRREISTGTSATTTTLANAEDWEAD